MCIRRALCARCSVYSAGMIETMVREIWSEQGLDAFAARTDKRFDGVDRRFDQVDRRFEAVDLRFDAVDRRLEGVEQGLKDLRVETREEIRQLRGEFNSLRTELGSFQRTLLHLGAGTVATFAVGFAGLIATQL